jgi:hypothetical protein
MIYTHVLQRGPFGIRSPLEGIEGAFGSAGGGQDLAPDEGPAAPGLSGELGAELGGCAEGP